MSAIPSVAEAVAAFKQHVENLKQRPDILLGEVSIGPPADTARIQYFRANPSLLPAALVDLFELMDGAKVTWQFRQQPVQANEEWRGGYEDGSICLLPLSNETYFRTDYANEYTFFGPETTSLMFDQQLPEFGTWLVAYGPGGADAPVDEYYEPYDATEEDEERAKANADVASARLVFAIEDGTDPLSLTIPEYLMQAIAHDFALQWQTGDETEKEADNDEEEDE